MTKIKSLTVTIGKLEVTMSLEDAQELRRVLNETLGNNHMCPQPWPIVVPMPAPNPMPIGPFWGDHAITCETNTGGTVGEFVFPRNRITA